MDALEIGRWIIVPVELRPGVFALVQIPRRLTKEEAEKIARVVRAYGESE